MQSDFYIMPLAIMNDTTVNSLVHELFYTDFRSTFQSFHEEKKLFKKRVHILDYYYEIIITIHSCRCFSNVD